MSKIEFESIPVYESKHFLDFVHIGCLPSYRDESNDGQNKIQRTYYKMSCVIELQDGGVKLEAVEDDNELHLGMFDICFKHGHFKIPNFIVNDRTKTFLCNIIAYEQHSSDDEPKYFSDYAYLMDKLINSKEDMNQLRRPEVLDNLLDDDKEVALMFNNLSKGMLVLK